MRLTLIEVPYDSGRFGERMGRGPQLLAAELPAMLAAEGHAAEVRSVRLPAGFFPEVAAVAALQAGVAREILRARAGGRLPVVLAGNCAYAALGAVAALGPRVGVLWLDAHGDFNTPETSPSGFFDGTALATLTGRCWRAAARSFAGFSPVGEEQVVLLGARALDAGEREALESSAVRWLPPRALRGDGEALALALAGLAGSAGLYLHLDLDVLDPAALRANRYAVADGLTLDEVVGVFRGAAERLEILAVALTAYDPEVDVERRGGRACLRVLTALSSPVGPGSPAPA